MTLAKILAGSGLLFVAACSSPPPSVAPIDAGVYTGALPATRGGGDERQARITLRADGAAAVQAVFYEPVRSEFFAEGRWREEGGRIVIELAGERPQTITFSRSGPQLAPREWDRAVWGEKGPPVLYRLIRPTVTG